jgi:translation elongation factor EF-Ts
MELRIASDCDLVNCYKSLQKLNEDCEKLWAWLKELQKPHFPLRGYWCLIRAGRR